MSDLSPFFALGEFRSGAVLRLHSFLALGLGGVCVLLRDIELSDDPTLPFEFLLWLGLDSNMEVGVTGAMESEEGVRTVVR